MRIVVLPLQWGGILVVLADVAHELLVEVLGAGEDAARNHVALDAGEPVLNLVEPRRISWRVMDRYLLVLGQEHLDSIRLVAAHVVADDVDLAALRLAGYDVGEESDKLRARMARRSLTQNLTGRRVQGGKQAQGAVAFVLEAVAFRPTRRQGQQAIFAIQRLNSRLLIHTEHHGVRRRVQIEPN